MMEFIDIFIAFTVGMIFGVGLMSCCVLAGREDRELEKLYEHSKAQPKSNEKITVTENSVRVDYIGGDE